MQISKSEYMLFLKHPAWLWIKKHAKHLMPSVDESLQARFDEGHSFEPLVESLYPNLIRLGFNSYSEYLDMPNKTSETWENGAVVVSQGRYETGYITCISDIVRRDGDKFVLTEIKSSSSAKKEHELDLAFQKVVLEGAGYPINRCEVAHVNSSYVRKGDISPRELIRFTDITQEVEELIDGTKRRIEKAIHVATANDMPDPSPDQAKLKSYKDWLSVREKLSPPLPPNSIHYLPSMDAAKSSKLAKEGIATIDEIKDWTVLKPSTQKYLAAKAEGIRTVEKDKIKTFLSEITYPVYYFDYESSQSLIPPWDGTRPYQQVPFQYSLHILRDPNGPVEHRGYLHSDISNPMPGLIDSLKEHIGNEGSILVWYESYEKSRNKEMAKTYPESADFLTSLNDRIIDLMKPFSQGMIRDEAFLGSSSIKKVLPALFPNMTYDNLGIQEGETAARKWKEITLGDVSEAERQKVYSDLIEYCRLDTFAMVEIHATLRALVE
jgi:hypothetical protein